MKNAALILCHSLISIKHKIPCNNCIFKKDILSYNVPVRITWNLSRGLRWPLELGMLMNTQFDLS